MDERRKSKKTKKVCKKSNVIESKECDLCKISSDTGEDEFMFGEWMEYKNLKVHYYCLLLSTHLPQRGADSSGILGFLVSDIRREIAAAAKRVCCVCGQQHASLMCRMCKVYFHTKCGNRSGALYQFAGEFPVYCGKCYPLDDHQRAVMKSPKVADVPCSICFDAMGRYKPSLSIHAPCCGNGYVHRICLQMYAMDAGYYLRCIWCRSPDFRKFARLLGIFVPDRDAQWENRGTYNDLHRGHQRCDMDVCHNPKGRDHISAKWSLILCKMCGSFGAHNPHCVPGMSRSQGPLKTFTCKVCSDIQERTFCGNPERPANRTIHMEQHDLINQSLFTIKETVTEIDNRPASATFSDEGSISSECSVQTVLRMPRPPVPKAFDVPKSEEPRSPEDHPSIALETGTSTPAPQPDANDEQISSETNGKASCSFAVSETIIDESDDTLACEDGKTLEAYEFDALWRCINAATVRINLNEPRFKGKSLEDIAESTEPILNKADVIDSHPDIGVWAEINAIIEEYAD